MAFGVFTSIPATIFSMLGGRDKDAESCQLQPSPGPAGTFFLQDQRRAATEQIPSPHGAAINLGRLIPLGAWGTAATASLFHLPESSSTPDPHLLAPKAGEIRQNICAFSAGGCRVCLHPSPVFSQRCLPGHPSMLCLLPMPQSLRSTSQLSSLFGFHSLWPCNSIPPMAIPLLQSPPCVVGECRAMQAEAPHRNSTDAGIRGNKGCESAWGCQPGPLLATGKLPSVSQMSPTAPAYSGTTTTSLEGEWG